MVTGYPVVTLTTDFGQEDSYVGELKGAIVSTAPGVSIVDITHQIHPHNIFHGALVVSQAARAFPAGTVHLGVIDPGVGTKRRRIFLKAAVGELEVEQYFVGPDNGLFSFVGKQLWAWEINLEAISPKSPLTTFDGRDVFAPIAARLAGGEDPGHLGTPLDINSLVGLVKPEPKVEGNYLYGEVLYLDCFGNAVTNIHKSALGTSRIESCEIKGERGYPFDTYQAIPEDTLGIILNSQQNYELAVYQKGAAQLFGIKRGDNLTVVLAK